MSIIDIKNNRVDEIIEMRTLLDKISDIDELESVLKKLDDYNITYDDLKVTKVGISLKKLTKHKSDIIAKKAETLINKWKKLIDKNSNTNGNKESSTTTSTQPKADTKKGNIYIKV
jgi:hypothetical protein